MLFEDLVRRILTAINFDVAKNDVRGERGFDLLATLGNEQLAIEVKYYRTARAQPSLIEAAALRLVNNAVHAQAMKAVLVVSCVIPHKLEEQLVKKFNLVFVDRDVLRVWVANFPDLLEELDALLELDPSQPHRVRSTEDSHQPNSVWTKTRHLKYIPPQPQDTMGTDLCRELKTVKRGRAEWAKYERICAKILKYLFPHDLHGWHSQKRTDDGLSRFDFVCRVRPTTEFWKFVIDHLNSRYVLFEFKNYSGEIKQGQILTTEKYLLERGLRRLAIILTRKGVKRDAIAMTQGAMREHGKLMLVVNDEKLCEMLHMKEEGEDPTDCLFDLADNFLLTLPR